MHRLQVDLGAKSLDLSLDPLLLVLGGDEGTGEGGLAQRVVLTHDGDRYQKAPGLVLVDRLGVAQHVALQSVVAVAAKRVDHFQGRECATKLHEMFSCSVVGLDALVVHVDAAEVGRRVVDYQLTLFDGVERKQDVVGGGGVEPLHDSLGVGEDVLVVRHLQELVLLEYGIGAGDADVLALRGSEWLVSAE